MYIEKRQVDNFHFYQHVLDTKKKESQNSSNDANLSVADYDDTMVQTVSQFKNVTK